MSMTVTTIGTAIVTGLAVGTTIAGIMKTRFMTKKECEEDQRLCSQQICKKIDKLADSLEELKKIRSDEWKLLYQFVGRVEQYMKEHT